MRRPHARREVQAGLRTRLARGVVGHPGALGDDPCQLAELELGPLVAQQRQPDPLAPDVGQGDVDGEQALVVHRRAQDRGPGRPDHLGAAPERDRLVDPDAVAEHHERGRQLGVGPHQRPPRRRRPQADLVRGGQVAARRRRHVDEDLRAVEREQLRHGQVPEVLADADAEPDAEARRNGPEHVARPEEPALVEQPVGRQEQLAVDVADLAVLEQGRRDEQPVVGRLLDEGDDGREVLGRGGELGQPGVVEPERDLRRQVLELVAGQAQLREDDEVGLLGAGLLQELVVTSQIAVQLPQARRQLGERHADGLHGASIREAPFGRPFGEPLRSVTAAPPGASVPAPARIETVPRVRRHAP